MMDLSVNVNCAVHHGLGRSKPFLVVVRHPKSESNAGSEVTQAHMKPKKRNTAEGFVEY